MEIKYKMIPDLHHAGCLTVHPDTAARLGIHDRDKVTCRFGIQTEDLQLVTSDDLDIQEVTISEHNLEVLCIPPAPRYEILYSNDELLIGPYIGMLVTSSEQELKERVSSLTSYLYDYEHIGGAILAFSLDGVQPEKLRIKGYLFNPHTKKWDKGTYAYPASMFSILEASLTGGWDHFQTTMRHFQSVMGDRIFNHPLFNKWEMYVWLRQSPKFEKNLPETILYERPEDAYRMIDQHQSVYMKPIWGRLGVMVIKACKIRNGFIVKYRVVNQNHMLFFRTIHEFDHFLQQNLEPGNFIVQKSIDLPSIDGKIIDFRLMLVKDRHGDWKDVGFFSRYGAENSIVSNITAGGQAKWGKTTLMELFDLTDVEAAERIQKMTDLAVEVAKVIEANGIHCGNLGLDLAVDSQERIWILEINNQNPDHYIAILAGKKNIFVQARRANMLYAKRLAGFANPKTKEAR